MSLGCGRCSKAFRKNVVEIPQDDFYEAAQKIQSAASMIANNVRKGISDKTKQTHIFTRFLAPLAIIGVAIIAVVGFKKQRIEVDPSHRGLTDADEI